jgi:hypothetical protein
MGAIVYKITYPNGKIYVGKDETNNISYFGTPNPDLIAADFNVEQRKALQVVREVLWESEVATRSEINAMETLLIRELGANDPDRGYNRWPKFRPQLDLSEIGKARKVGGPA